MHELGITQEIVTIAAEAGQGAQVKKVVLVIGQLTTLLPDAVRFCFELCSEGTEVEGAQLEIIEIEGRARCRSCSAEFALDVPYGICDCGGADLEWLSGEELKIKELEVA